jgi:hypothetical protein
MNSKEVWDDLMKLKDNEWCRILAYMFGRYATDEKFVEIIKEQIDNYKEK